MEFSDNNKDGVITRICNLDRDTIYLSDSVYNIMEKNMSEHVTEIAETVVDKHVSTEPIGDAVATATEMAESDTLEKVIGDFDGDVLAAEVLEKDNEEATRLKEKGIKFSFVDYQRI